MRRLFLSKKGQSVLDYTLLIGAICVGLVLAGRALQGRLRSGADEIGSQYDVEHGQFKEFRYSESDSVEEIGDNLTVVDINKQFRGSKDWVVTPEVGETADATLPTTTNPYTDDWNNGTITWPTQ